MKRNLQLLVLSCLCTLCCISTHAIENLPISYKGPWQTPTIDGFTASLGSADNTTTGVAANFSKATNFFQIQFNGQPKAMTYRVRTGNPTSTFKFEVAESVDGISWNVIKTYTELATTDANNKMASVSGNPHLDKCDLKSTTRFVKWTLTERQSTGGTNIYLSDVNIYEANSQTTDAPIFVALLNNSDPKQEIVNGGIVTPTASTTSLNFNFNKLVFINDYSQFKINNGTSNVAISPYFYSSANNPTDNANNVYSCTESDYIIRVSNLVFVEGETYTITIPANNVVDVYGNPLANDINYTFKVTADSNSIDNITIAKEIQSVEYYTLTGAKIESPISGVFVKKVTYTDNSTNISKVIK